MAVDRLAIDFNRNDMRLYMNLLFYMMLVREPLEQVMDELKTDKRYQIHSVLSHDARRWAEDVMPTL